jgi:hypothetical protein
MFTYLYAHIRPILVNMLPYPYIYISLNTCMTTLLYKFTYFYANIYLFVFTKFYGHSDTVLHKSILVHPYTFTFFNAHVSPIQHYIFLCAYRPYTYLHTSTNIWLYMFTYFYGHIPMHVYILLRPHIDTKFHTFTIYLYIFTYFFANIVIYIYVILQPLTDMC